VQVVRPGPSDTGSAGDPAGRSSASTSSRRVTSCAALGRSRGSGFSAAQDREREVVGTRRRVHPRRHRHVLALAHRQLPGEQTKQQQAQRVDIALVGEALAGTGLRRRPGQRLDASVRDDHAGLGRRHVSTNRGAVEVRLGQRGTTKVQQRDPRAALQIDQDVVRVDVAVHNAARVHVGEDPGELQADLRDLDMTQPARVRQEAELRGRHARRTGHAM
jgi:hypothetical protein